MTTRDERYIRIAKACLRAINQTAGGKKDISDDIQRVYEAIDAAFRQEFVTLEKEMVFASESLQQIAEHDEDSLELAKELAAQALSHITYWGTDEAKH